LVVAVAVVAEFDAFIEGDDGLVGVARGFELRNARMARTSPELASTSPPWLEGRLLARWWSRLLYVKHSSRYASDADE
jgi:hypothetical protein